MSARLDSVLHYVRRVLGKQDEQGSDADLLQRFVRQHDETAFELLLWRHAAMVLRVCQGVLRDSHAAEDAFQATFLALARKAGSISRSESLAAWLYQVAYRVAVRAKLNAAERRALELRRHERRTPTRPAGPDSEVAERDLVPLVHEELNRLSAKYRTPIVLCYLEGKTHAEAAEQLGWPKGTVSGRLARAREMLKKRLVRRGVLFPTAVLGVALAAGKASAVPPALVAATAHAAVAFAAGNIAAAGVSNGVIHLSYGVLHAMCVSKIKATFAAVIAFLLIFAGAGALVRVGLVEASAREASAEMQRYRPPTATLPMTQGIRLGGPTAAEDEDDSGGPPGSAAGALPGFGQPPASPGSGGQAAPGQFPPGVGGPMGPGAGSGAFPGGPGFGQGPPTGPGRPGAGPGGFAGGPGSPANDNLAERKRRIDSSNKLKQIALAFHNYHDATGAFPADIVDDFGRPLLSWRVAILPYIEQDPLFMKFNLEESWDSPHNKQLLAKMPALYRGPSPGEGMTPDDFQTKTFYQGFSGKGTLFDRAVGRIRMTDVPDGLSQTLLVVEAGSSVPWTKPQDLPYNSKKALPKLGVFPEVIQAVFADGAVHGLRPDFDEQEMRKAIVRNDGEELNLDKLQLPQKVQAGPMSGGMAGGKMGGPPGMFGPGSGGGRPGGMPPGMDADLAKMREENAALEKMLDKTAVEMQSLRQEMDQLREQYSQRRRVQVEAEKLAAEREKLREALEDATAEIQAMRDELQRLKRSLEKP
jgi:RNA polymerase sigma factor (sigma-70 family)